METSIGIFETKGFAAAIAGADKILENNKIEFIKIESSGGGIISLFFKGSNEQLKSAFEIGIKQSRLVGEIIAVYVTREPNKKIDQMLFQSNTITEVITHQKKIEQEKPIIKKVDTQKPKKSIEETPIISKQNKSSKFLTSISTIQRLRREALSSDALLKKRALKSTSMEGKTSAQINISKLESMNVHELRRLARNTGGFPIQGREISKANRKELIVYFKESV